MGSIDPVSPEEELALNVKVENIVSVTIQLTAALMALRKAVDIISHQPTLILSIVTNGPHGNWQRTSRNR
jgi:hypothetical protein